VLYNVFKQTRWFGGLLGLAAVLTLFAVSHDAEAVKAKHGKARAPLKLKKLTPAKINPNAKDPFPNLTAIGITGEDNPGGGCRVRAVAFNSPAEAGGLEPGDIIIQVENLAVNTAADADSDVGQDLQNNAPDVFMYVRDVNNLNGPPVGLTLPLSSSSPAIKSKADGKTKN
jgi:S1-C subfamily serine protease